MFGKLFGQMYDSSLVEDWRAMVTFQQLIILCDADGIVDMTPEAIVRRTNLPADIIEHGLHALQQPDPRSRTPDEEGRRIIPLDEHREWGWRIVNHGYYRDLASKEDKREKDRARIARKREMARKANESGGVAGCREVSRMSPMQDTYTDTDTREEGSSSAVSHPTYTRPVGLRAYLDDCKEAGVKPIPEDDAVFRYAEEVGIPAAYLELCWLEFCERMLEQGKRYKSWRQAFRNCVRGGWYQLWFIGDSGFGLTTKGKQAERKHRRIIEGNYHGEGM